MITINAGATNSITLRFNDNKTLVDPLYLFEFQCVQSGELFYCVPQDTSPNTRYNQFYIREISDTGLTASLTASTPYLELSYGGFYNYKVYEVQDYGLTPSDTILDYGKMVFRNGEYQSFFFEVNNDEIEVFDSYESFKEFIYQNVTFKVFDEYETRTAFDADNYNPIKIFDPETIFRVLTTEVYAEALKTEEGYTLSW